MFISVLAIFSFLYHRVIPLIIYYILNLLRSAYYCAFFGLARKTCPPWRYQLHTTQLRIPVTFPM